MLTSQRYSLLTRHVLLAAFEQCVVDTTTKSDVKAVGVWVWPAAEGQLHSSVHVTERFRRIVPESNVILRAVVISNSDNLRMKVRDSSLELDSCRSYRFRPSRGSGGVEAASRRR